MKKILFLIAFVYTTVSIAQNKLDNSIVAKPLSVKQAVDFKITKPLREMEPYKGPISDEEYRNNKIIKEAHEKKLNANRKVRNYPFADIALPKGADAVWQNNMGLNNPYANKGVDSTTLIFNGQDSPYLPSDCNGAVGPNHYMQGVNSSFAIYDKSGNVLVPSTAFNTLFNGVVGAGTNDGDIIVMYDKNAARWFVSEFSISGNNDYMLIAVSVTDDPTGSWYAYSFDVDDMPDYMKFGVWRDGYYMGDNNWVGKDIYVFERDVMLAGGQYPKMVGFNNPNRPSSGFHCVEPLDTDGPFAPSGTPGQFITVNDDAWGGGGDALWIFELDVDWTNISNSSFQRTQVVSVSPFSTNFGSSWANITQKGTTQKLDAIPQIIMFRAQYRNFGNKQTIVCAHTVEINSSNYAGIRWYELENVGSGWSIRQQGTYAPDTENRWMPSIAMDANHNIAIGYSVAGTNTFPSIRFCGQSSAENYLASGIMDITEQSIYEGIHFQSGYSRWGDYAEMTLDPNDDATFWFTSEYYSGGKRTKIASFQFEQPTFHNINTGVLQLVSPTSGAMKTDTESVVIAVKNYGLDTLSNIPVAYKFNGTTAITGIITDTILPGEIYNYTFNSTVDMLALGSYSFEAYTYLNSDTILVNDTITKIVENQEPVYCDGYGTASLGNEYISKVEFANINNSSNESNYTDFTNVSTSVSKGNPYNITIDISGGYNGGGYNYDRCLVWADWNQNYSFADTTEFYDLGIGSGPASGIIDVPASAKLGNTVMRIRLYNSIYYSDLLGPCGYSNFGEVEDYTVKVTDWILNNNVSSNKSDFVIFPNPANTYITVESFNKLDKTCTVLDISGRIIKQFSNNSLQLTIDISDLEKGIYFVKLQSKEGIAIKKFIKG